MGCGDQQVLAAEASFDGRRDRSHVGGGLQLLTVGVGARDVTGSSFLEQQGRCAHHRLGVEAVSHQPVQYGVVDADDGHSLVVCHVAADEGVAIVA